MKQMLIDYFNLTIGDQDDLFWLSLCFLVAGEADLLLY